MNSQQDTTTLLLVYFKQPNFQALTYWRKLAFEAVLKFGREKSSLSRDERFVQSRVALLLMPIDDDTCIAADSLRFLQ